MLLSLKGINYMKLQEKDMYTNFWITRDNSIASIYGAENGLFRAIKQTSSGEQSYLINDDGQVGTEDNDSDIVSHISAHLTETQLNLFKTVVFMSYSVAATQDEINRISRI
jgi:hypothetical protein